MYQEYPEALPSAPAGVLAPVAGLARAEVVPVADPVPAEVPASAVMAVPVANLVPPGDAALASVLFRAQDSLFHQMQML